MVSMLGVLYAMFVMNKNDLVSSTDELYSCFGERFLLCRVEFRK